MLPAGCPTGPVAMRGAGLRLRWRSRTHTRVGIKPHDASAKSEPGWSRYGLAETLIRSSTGDRFWVLRGIGPC